VRLLLTALTAGKGAGAALAVSFLGLGGTSGYLALRDAQPVKTTRRAHVAISGAAARGALLFPGGPPVPINVVFRNRNAFRITVRNIRVKVVGTSRRGCRASNFVVVRQLRARPTVRARSKRSLAALGVRRSLWPQLRMLDRGNQNACRRAKVLLRFSTGAPK
jgi:hypothetical protein